MNLGQLVTFQAVMTSANLTEAASKLGRSQPAVSSAIKSLEDQLGLKLFERRGRRLVPAPEARYLLAEADDIIAQVDRVRQTMRGLVSGHSGKLAVAAMPGPVSMLFPQFVARYLAEEADVSVSLFARSSNQITELARAQTIDFGFADIPEDAKTQNLYEARPITGRCFVAIPFDHPLSERKVLSLADLGKEPLGSLQAHHPHQKAVEAGFHAQAIEHRTVIESQTFLPILQFVKTARCCAIIDPLTVAHVRQSPEALHGITIRPLVEPIRYRYAILSPLHRPVSIISQNLKQAWFERVVEILDDVGAEPQTGDE